MNELLMLLLEKAKAAHYHWTVNNPQMLQIKAMAELGDAIQLSEATLPEKQTYKLGPVCYWRDKSFCGELQKFYACLMFEEKTNTPYICIRIRTLTTQPQKYDHDTILRTFKGLTLIQKEFNMRYHCWLDMYNAIKELNIAYDNR